MTDLEKERILRISKMAKKKIPLKGGQLVKQNGGRGRPSNLVINTRTKEVAMMLLANTPRTQIIDYCVLNYKIKEISVPNIITSAYKFIKENYVCDLQGTVALHIDHYYEIYTQAKGMGDNRGAIAALNSIEKLLKLTDNPLIQNNNLTLNLKDLNLNDLKTLLTGDNQLNS